MARPNQPRVFRTLAKSRKQQGESPKNLSSRTLTILLLLLIPPALVLFTILPPSLRNLTLIYALIVNITTFLVYRHDKKMAIAAGSACSAGGYSWRVREVSLHLWALAGGWPAAFLAQRVLRHKTRKWEFLGVFWVIVVGEEMVLCLMIWYFVV